MKKQHYESACPLLSPLTPTPTPTPCEMECKRIAVKSSRVPLRFRMRSKRKGEVPCAFPYIRQALPHLPHSLPLFASYSLPLIRLHLLLGRFVRCLPGVASVLTEFLAESHFPYTCVRLGEAHSSASQAKYAQILDFCSASSRPVLEIILPSYATFFYM